MIALFDRSARLTGCRVVATVIWRTLILTGFFRRQSDIFRTDKRGSHYQIAC